MRVFLWFKGKSLVIGSCMPLGFEPYPKHKFTDIGRRSQFFVGSGFPALEFITRQDQNLLFHGG